MVGLLDTALPGSSRIYRDTALKCVARGQVIEVGPPLGYQPNIIAVVDHDEVVAGSQPAMP